MFYSQFILAKKGPLGTIWIAAHLERKLRKNQVADTDIGVSVAYYLNPKYQYRCKLGLVQELVDAVQVVAAKLEPNSRMQPKCNQEIKTFRDALGSFGRLAAIDGRAGADADSILFPEVPIALRLSSHLLLGVVRIYSRKVNYLFHDCSEALLKVKQAFRSTVVDLPPDESTAPYHSITLPETFDLDDFELPDSALFQGNYVDHHVSTREQITLQDTMDGVVYSTTQFGLDERFGDGDTSQIGLDLDEDLLLDKAALSRHAEDLLPSEEDVGPQPCGEPMTPFTGMDIVEDDYNTERTAEIPEVILADGSGKQIGSNALELSMDDKSVFCNDQIKSPDLNVEGFRYKQIEGQYANPTKDLVEFSLPPSTSALAEDAILANVEGYPNKMASPCQSKDCNSMNLVVAGKPGDSIRELDVHIGNANYALECALLSDEKSGFDVLSMPSGKNESLTGGVQAIHVKQQGNSTPADSMDPVASDISRLVSSPTSVLAEQPKPVSPVSECSDRIAAVLDGQEGVISNNGLSISTIDQIHTKGMATQAIAVDTTVSFPACSPDALMLEETCGRPPCDNDTTISYKETSEPEAIKSEELVGDGAESCSRIHELQSSADFLLGSEARHEIDQAEGNASAKPHDSNILNKYGPGEKSHTGSHVLQPCSLQSNQLGVSSPPDGSLVENIPNLCCGRDGLLLTKTSEREEIPQASALSTDAQGEGCNQGLVANSIAEPFQPEDVQALSELDEHLDGVILEGTQLQISNFSASSDLPAPETLLSALPGAELPSDVMVGLILNKENPTEGSGDGSEVLSGKRHHSLESSPVLWSGKSAELSGVPQSRNVDSIPDDNDLLSSILVGRRSSALKVRPTPPSEVPSSKRPRVATRAHVPKRKVLVDDTMVLHGDTIRQQLTNTEDIRRIQRKAPCTRPEIWIIQKQLLEDEIFSEPIFTGMPMQLTGLQNRTYDLAKAELFQIDANCTPLGVLKGMKHTVSTDIAKETSLESCSKDVAVRHDGGALPAAVHVQAEDQHSKEHASLEGCEAVLVTNEGEAQTSTLNSSKDGQLEIITAMEIDRVNDEISDVVDHAATPGAELAVPSGPLSGDSSNLLAGSLKLSPVDNSSGAEVILQNDEAYSPQNKKLDLHKKGALIMGGNDDNGIQALYIVKVNDKSSISPGAVRAAKDESALVEAEGGMLSECPQDCQIVRGENTSAMAVAELNNCSVETRAGVQADSSAISFENINSSFPSMCLESGEQTAVVIVTGDQNIRGNNGVLDENATWSEQVNDEDGVTTSVDMDDVIFHGGEDPGCAGANQKNTRDAEISMLHSSAARETDVFEDLIDGNDTEFLNVDDDEVAEEEDNNMPCAEDAQFFENSGWSTRTRAVARYLQTLFDNDAGHEREVVRMDHLLAGKTRKESARMFFETLVLKTRDYIHVEQENAFANINIRSRGKLMKANF